MKIQLLAQLKLVVRYIFLINKGMTLFYYLVNEKSADVVGVEKMGRTYVCAYINFLILKVWIKY